MFRGVAAMSKTVFCFMSLAGLALSVQAEVSLPKILGDNMVLQRDRNVPVWGQADPGEAVCVTFADQIKKTTANADGRWRVDLDPLPASVEPREMTVSAGNVICLKNIVVGEVWFCSGQSNMEMATGIRTAGADPAAKEDAQLAEDLQGDGYPEIRLFRVEKKIQPPDVISAGWGDCRGDVMARFSAIGCLFARRMQLELDVPVGVIQSAWGGSRIEPWTPPEAYSDSPVFAEEAARTPLKIDGMSPGKNFDGMVRPLAPFAIRGVLWYQGESNLISGNDGLRYADKMEVLVAGWRAVWQRPELPFLSVQIAPYPYSRRGKDPVKHSVTALAELWEGQAHALSIPGTGMVPTTDLVSNTRNIHPQEKRPVAERLARLALQMVYGRPDPELGSPMFDTVEQAGGSILVHFSRCAGGLRSRDGQALTCFEVAGADGIYAPAEAEITAPDTVRVFSSSMADPVSVRFGWHELAQPNLVDSNGWPAFPFRSHAASVPSLD